MRFSFEPHFNDKLAIFSDDGESVHGGGDGASSDHSAVAGSVLIYEKYEIKIVLTTSAIVLSLVAGSVQKYKKDKGRKVFFYLFYFIFTVL